MKHSTLIIGGGIVGFTLAMKLAKAHHSVILIDARMALDEKAWQCKLSKRDARVYALNLASINLLKEVGIWDYIEQSGRKADYTQMHVWQTNGIGDLYFADDIQTTGSVDSEDNIDILGSMVEPIVLEHAIHQRCQSDDISKYLRVVSGSKVISLDWLGEEAGYKVDLDNGSTYQAKLLVGADGRRSSVRKLAGIGLETLDYNQTAICCAIKTTKPHLSTARQGMLPTGTLALLPLADINNEDKINPQHWQSVVWTLPTYKAIDLLMLSDDRISEEISFASSYELGRVEQIESIDSFPLSAQQAKSYIKPNLALVGDAAHGVHPLAGQGLNLGMLDAIALSELLIKDYKRSAKLNKVGQWGHYQTLKRYEYQRRVDNSVMMHSFSILNWLFAGELAQFGAIQHLRSEGMALVAKTKPLMKWFTKKASGL